MHMARDNQDQVGPWHSDFVMTENVGDKPQTGTDYSAFSSVRRRTEQWEHRGDTAEHSEQHGAVSTEAGDAGITHGAGVGLSENMILEYERQFGAGIGRKDTTGEPIRTTYLLCARESPCCRLPFGYFLRHHSQS